MRPVPRIRHDRQRHAPAAPWPRRHGALERRPRRRRGLHARARARVGGGRHRPRPGDRRRPLLHPASLRKYPEPVWRAAARTVPLQRLGREQEHAWLVVLAASPLGPRVVRLAGYARRRARQTGPARGRRPRCSTRPAPSRLRSGGRAPATGAPRTAIIGLVRCGRSVVVAQKPSKLLGRVRFPSPALRQDISGSGAVW